MGSGGIRGRKRSCDEFDMGAGNTFQAIYQAPVPQALSQGPPGRYYQQSAFLLPPLMFPAEVQAAYPHRNPISATTQPEPSQVPATTIRGSQATTDILAMDATRPQLSIDHLYSSQVWASNQPSGPGYQIYSVPHVQQPVPRSLGADSVSIDPTRLTATYSGDSSPQVHRGIMPQSTHQHRLAQWLQERLDRGASGSEHVAGMQFQESTAPAGDVMIEGSMWFPTSGGPSWPGM